VAVEQAGGSDRTAIDLAPDQLDKFKTPFVRVTRSTEHG
jgi:hypothetical protein